MPRGFPYEVFAHYTELLRGAYQPLPPEY